MLFRSGAVGVVGATAGVWMTCPVCEAEVEVAAMDCPDCGAVLRWPESEEPEAWLKSWQVEREA